jgi:hypothetical protein
MPGKTKKKLSKQYVRFNEGMYARAYEAAREGLKGGQLARAIGTDLRTLKKWKKKYPFFTEAIELARKYKGASGISKFIDYVYGVLSPELQQVWDKISAWENEPNAISRITALLDKNGEYARMHLFAHALIKNNFSVTNACRTLCMSFPRMEDMIMRNPDFGKILEQMKLCKQDFYETALVKLVDAGEPSAVIFANKTYNRNRGYNEKTELEVTGSITNTHLVDISVLNLPIEVKKMILEAYRKHKEGVPIPEAPANTIEYKRIGNSAVPVNEEEAA